MLLLLLLMLSIGEVMRVIWLLVVG